MSFPFYDAGILEQVFSIWYLAVCGDRSLKYEPSGYEYDALEKSRIRESIDEYQVLNTKYRR